MSKTGKMKMWGRTQIVEKNMIFFGFFCFFFCVGARDEIHM